MVGNPEVNNSELSILVTDDDDAFRRALRGVFENRGFQLFEACNGEEAIEIVQGESVHIALLDMHMPRLTGLDTLRILKKINALIPCIIMSADMTERLVREALLARAYTVLSKPVSSKFIVHSVIHALRHNYPITKTQENNLNSVKEKNFDSQNRLNDMPEL